MKTRFFTLVAAATLIIAGGCTTQAPTIAHVHVGHAMTGWRNTPNKEGLLVTAEAEALAVLEEAHRAVAAGNDLAQTKRSVRNLLHALDPALSPGADGGLGFGLLPAVQDTISHMEFAAESDDASQNIRDSVPRIAERSNEIIGRCEEVRVLGEAVMVSGSPAESSILAGEVLGLSERIVDGSSAGVYGLTQLRGDIRAMIGRESPPYTTVDTWYLLNLVRLPSGKWDFVQQDKKKSGGRGGMSSY